MQPGGHADGKGNLFQVALDEASEETGLDLSIFIPVTNLIFDIDIHKIPKLIPESIKISEDLYWSGNFEIILKFIFIP